MQRHSKQLINLNWNAVNPKWHELNRNPTNPKRIMQGKYPKHNKAQWNKHRWNKTNLKRSESKMQCSKSKRRHTKSKMWVVKNMKFWKENWVALQLSSCPFLFCVWWERMVIGAGSYMLSRLLYFKIQVIISFCFSISGPSCS